MKNSELLAPSCPERHLIRRLRAEAANAQQVAAKTDELAVADIMTEERDLLLSAAARIEALERTAMLRILWPRLCWACIGACLLLGFLTWKVMS
jgi:hypothetical protein